MNKLILIALIGLLLSITVSRVLAQPEMLPEQLIMSMKTGDLTNAIEIARNIDSVNYTGKDGTSLLMHAVERRLYQSMSDTD